MQELIKRNYICGSILQFLSHVKDAKDFNILRSDSPTTVSDKRFTSVWVSQSLQSKRTKKYSATFMDISYIAWRTSRSIVLRFDCPTPTRFIASFNYEGEIYTSKNFVACIEFAESVFRAYPDTAVSEECFVSERMSELLSELWRELLTKVLFSNPATPWAMKVNSSEQTVVMKKTCFHYHKIVLEMTLPVLLQL